MGPFRVMRGGTVVLAFTIRLDLGYWYHRRSVGPSDILYLVPGNTQEGTPHPFFQTNFGADFFSTSVTVSGNKATIFVVGVSLPLRGLLLEKTDSEIRPRVSYIKCCTAVSDTQEPPV